MQKTRNQKPKIALVVPVYNEAGSIGLFLEVTQSVLHETGCPHRIIFVDDGSSDETISVLRAAKNAHPEIFIISLARNFGKEAALTAGLDYADEDVVILVDVDLQDPPGLVHDFLHYWRQGFDVIYGVRVERHGDSFLKRATAASFYKVFNRISRTKIPFNAGDYRLLDRRVVLEIRRLRERNRFMKGLMAWPGFKTKGVPFERAPRIAGSSSFNYRRLWNFAIDGLTSFSATPLRIWIYFGAIVAMISFLFGLFIMVQALLYGNDVAGYPSLMVAVTFFSGVQLLTMGLMGEYIGRTFEEVKARPIYVIDTIEE